MAEYDITIEMIKITQDKETKDEMFSGKGAKYELVLGSDLMQSDPVTLSENGFAAEQEYNKKFKIEDIDNVTNIKIIRGEGQNKSLPFACK